MYETVAATLREASERGSRVRVRGAGTKLGWGIPVPEPEVEVDTRGFGRIVEHNVGDLTAIVQAGVRLADLHDELAKAGQMLAIDPPLIDGATVGGTLATADSGPLRHRYGAPRDLVLGMTVVGVSYGSLQNLTLVAAFAAVPARQHSTASAVWNIGFDAGTGLGSLVVGFIAAGTSFSVGLLTTAAVCVVAAVAVLLTRPSR